MSYDDLNELLRSATRCHAGGRLAQAERIYRRILARRPDHCDALHYLGLIAYQSGRHAVAIDLIRRAITLNPNGGDKHDSLGVILKEQGQLDRAILAHRQAVALGPNSAAAYYNLGIALKDQGELDQAIAAFGKSIALNPNSAQVHNNLAIALRERGQLEQAIVAFRKAIAVNPKMAAGHYNLGLALKDQGKLLEAVAEYRKALAIQPDFALAHNVLGIALEQMGDFKEAERCYRNGIQHDKKNGEFHANLAKLLGSELPDKDWAEIQSLAAHPSANVASRTALHFGAAYVLDARKRYPQAAEHLSLAHALCKANAWRKGAAYDPAAHEQFISRMIETCSTEFFRRAQGIGLQTQRPVFIVGLPRSGTTLIEQILAAHSRVFAAGELQFAKADFRSLAEVSAENPLASAVEERCFLALSRLDRDTAQQVARRHLDELEKLNRAAHRVIDKKPDNFIYLGLLAALFPQATFIHCCRDLRDVAVSCWATQFETISWHHDLEHLTSYFDQYRRLMRHWRTVLDGRWLDCHYEQTVTDLPTAARRLIDWCGLEWEPACLDFHLVKRPIRTSSARQVRQPIYDRSIARWKHYSDILAPVLDRLS